MDSHKKSKLIIFDFDGTLVDLPTDYKRLKRELHAYFVSFGLDIEFTPLLEKISFALKCLENKKATKNELLKIKKEVHKIIDRYELLAFDNVIPHESFLSFVRKNKRRYEYCIVSQNGSKVIEETIRKFNLPEPLFIISRSNSREPKPNPKELLLKLSESGIDKKDCVIVGDKPVDKELGDNAGILTFIVSPETESGRLSKLQDFG